MEVMELVQVLQGYVNAHNAGMNLQKLQEFHVETSNVQNVKHHYAVLINKLKVMEITLICIPTVEGGLLSRISTHFGKTSYFTFIKLKMAKLKKLL